MTEWYGWDPASKTAPPPFPDGVFPFHYNTGLFLEEHRKLEKDGGKLRVHVGDYVAKAGEVVRHLRVTGKFIAKGAGVVAIFCDLQGQIDSAAVGSGEPPLFIYCDVIYQGGAAGTKSVNMTKGQVRMYRCNFANWIDGIGIKNKEVSTAQRSVMQNCFGHDSRVVPSDGMNTPSHNDLAYQTNQKGSKISVVGNTLFLTGTNNDSGKETCTRSSGPHWRGDDPLTVTFDGMGSKGATGGVKNGRINAGMMVKKDLKCEVEFRGNLLRGYAYTGIQSLSGNTWTITDNLAAPEELEAGRSNPLGKKSSIGKGKWEGNFHYKTKKPL